MQQVRRTRIKKHESKVNDEEHDSNKFERSRCRDHQPIRQTIILALFGKDRRMTVQQFGFVAMIIFSFYHLIKNIPSHRQQEEGKEMILLKSKTIKHQQRDENVQLPLIILHPGPPKTGTSTIQDYIQRNQQFLSHGGNIRIYGRVKRNDATGKSRIGGSDKTSATPLVLMDEKSLRDCQNIQDNINHLKKTLERDRILNRTVIYSDETMFWVDDDCVEFWDGLKSLKKQWRVRVAFVYRRMFEWSLSHYAYQNNPLRESAPTLWPQEMGRRTVERPSDSFHVYFKKFFGDDDGRRPLNNSKVMHNPLQTMRRWKTHFSDVRVINMHNNGAGRNLVSNFLCHTIPEASRVCQKSMSEKTLLVSNARSSLKTTQPIYIDIIATEALKRGMVDGAAISRKDARDAIESYATRKLGLHSLEYFPLQCLSDNQLKIFWDASLRLEQESLQLSESYPDYPNEEFVSLRDRFDDAVERWKFCDVDVNLILGDQRWIDFFQNHI